MKWSASLIVDGINGGVVIKQHFHAGRALCIVGIDDAVIEWSKAA